MNKTFGANVLAALFALTAPAGHAQEQSAREENLAELIETLATSGFTEATLPLYHETVWADALTILAARDRDDLVAAIVDAGVDPDRLNSNGSTALQNAILAEADNAVAALLSLGADVTANRDGLTATGLAEATGNAVIVRLLRTSGDISDAIRLAIAVRTGDFERIEALLATGIDVNAVDADNATPMLHAALAGHMDAVTVLAERGGQVEAANSDGLTPLGVLVMAGGTEIVGDLLSSGANPNHKMNGIPVLSLAVVAGDDAMVDLLLERGADSTLASEDGATPGMLAMSLGRSELARRLGGIPEPEAAVDFIAAVNDGDVATVRRLLTDGEDPDQTADNGMPAIVIAAAAGDFATVVYLLRAGADVMSSDGNGNTAIHAAFAQSDEHAEARQSIANHVLRRASETNKLNALLAKTNNDGRSAFVRLAGTESSQHVASLLPNRLALRTAAERPDRDGISPMLAAVLSGNTTLVSRFAEMGVSFALPSGQGSAQDLARASQSWAVLAAMPDDRIIPEGFQKNATRSAQLQMQILLRDWGYYTGAIDGLFGPASFAALTKFLFDRDRELRAMAPHSKSITHGDSDPHEGDSTDYWLHAPGTNCKWKIEEWKPKDPSWATRFIGCVKDLKFTTHGFALVRYGTTDRLKFFGEHGWGNAAWDLP
ncbi:MAG: ankyrin repeat domain-containing protein [Rhodobacteraceae bacterium]|nr:ankyrin repeat domain-containing protein [Paracoccaceae bacterium]